MNKKVAGSPEINNARSRLDGVLQTLVNKKDESPVESDEEVKNESLFNVAELVLSSTTPRKGSTASNDIDNVYPVVQRFPKKRRKKEDSNENDGGQYHHTYVMKLFDRSVDLAQFDEETALYPICRAWMRNQPLNRNLGPRPRSPTPEPDPDDEDEEEDEEVPKNVYKMPDTIDVKIDVEHIGVDQRIPSPLPQPDEELNIYKEPDQTQAPEHLLLAHIERWQKIRQKWKHAGRSNDARYIPSYNTLKEIYDYQMSKEPG